MLGIILIVVIANLVSFLIIYFERKGLRIPKRKNIVDCSFCIHSKRRICIDSLSGEKEYYWVCDISGKVIPYCMEENVIVLPEEDCPLENEEKGEEK